MGIRKRETAAQLMARLHRDPEWVRENAQREAAQAERAARRLEAIEPEHAPLLAELEAAGVRVRVNDLFSGTEAKRPVEPARLRSISDLINTTDSYPQAVPILVRHLRNVRHPVMVDCIARALTVKEARGTVAAKVILDRLKQTTPSAETSGDNFLARWALANALTVIADQAMRSELAALARDASYQDVAERLRAAVKNLRR